MLGPHEAYITLYHYNLFLHGFRLRERHCSEIGKRLRSPGIDSKEQIPPAYVAQRAGRINMVVVPARYTTQTGGIDSLESIPGPHKRLKIRALIRR